MAKNPKPFIDALFEAEEGLEVDVRMRLSVFRRGDVVLLKTRYSPIRDKKYEGELIFETPLVQKQSRIINPNSIVKPN